MKEYKGKQKTADSMCKAYKSGGKVTSKMPTDAGAGGGKGRLEKAGMSTKGMKKGGKAK